MTQVFFESLHRSGIPFVARLLPSRHLLVLNFHRVRDEASPFHDGMIELNSKQFSEHMAWIARRADFVNEESLHTLKSGGRPKVMLTFDDGYSDAHEVVAPILEKAGIPASFFVAPGMLDQRKLGSWDRIAYLVKKCPVKKFQFRGRDFSLEDGIRSACLELGDWSQASLPDRGDEFVTDLASTLGIAPPSREEQSREMLTWDQVRDLCRRGFSIGCHGLSHRVLSSLSLEEQEEEILRARDRLTEEKISAGSFAYPFGSPETYSWETRQAVLRAGFKLIFSFSGQAPKISGIDPSRIDRVAFKSTLAKYDFLLSFPSAHNFAQRFRRSL